MKQYVIDELRIEDFEKLRDYLDGNFESSAMDGLYWVPLDEDIYSEVQKEHVECAPFFFAVDLEPERVAVELLVRTKNKIRCNCIAYADKVQRNWLIDMFEVVFEKLEIVS